MSVIQSFASHRPLNASLRVARVRSGRAESFFLAAMLAAATTALAPAHHEGDILLTIHDSRITTNALVEGVAVPERLFAATLGEFGIPGVGDEPGFDNEPGTFEPGSLIGFTLTSPLRVWDGADFDLTAPDPLAGVRMKLSFASLSVTTGDGEVDGFQLAVAPNGEWHVHYIFELLPATGDFEVPPGAYLLELSLHTTQEKISASKPFWILFNHELDEATFAEIVEAAEALLEDHHHDCPADLNGDKLVDGNDLGALLGQWGPCAGCEADFNGDGIVDGDDLGALLGLWGACD